MLRKGRKRFASGERALDRRPTFDGWLGTVIAEGLKSALVDTLIVAAFITATFLVAFCQKPVSNFPAESLPPGPMQAKAIAACEECHEARIILQQRLSKAVWTKEVDKMIKWGAVVDANDHDNLIDYLSVNFGIDKPPYEPPRTSSAKSHSSKTN